MLSGTFIVIMLLLILVTHHAHKARHMPLGIECLERPVSDWFLAPSTLWEDCVCVATVTVWVAVLLPVAHAARELDQAAIALEVFGVP